MASIIIKPNVEQKVALLAEAAKYDVCLSGCQNNGDKKGRIPNPADPLHLWSYPQSMPKDGQAQILKILQSTSCRNNCTYCAFSTGRDDQRRTTLEPQELADVFMKLVMARKIHGLFLSSGVCKNPDSAMQKMVETTDILRNVYKYKGYIHLKILPGAKFDLLEKATALATRISVNLEAPTREFLADIAPDKRFASDIVTRMKWAGKIIQNGSFTTSQTTQFVVGAARESDMDILKTTDWVYREMFIFRAYFSAFQPTLGDPDYEKRKVTLLREHRLYQSDYLLRGYGFRLPDLVFENGGNLPESVDPKTAYAMMHPELFPVDVNTADETALLKVPGIGPVSVKKIVDIRSTQPFHTLEDLKNAGIRVRQAAPYIELSGKKECQSHLFELPPPSSWHTNVAPAGLSDPTRQSPMDDKYNYPGQVGKRLTYAGLQKNRVIYCR